MLKRIFLFFYMLFVAYVCIYAYDNKIFDKYIDKFVASKQDLSEIIADGILISNDDVNKLEDSGIDGHEFEFDSLYYPYFYLLDEDNRLIYKQIYANILERKTSFVPIIKTDSDNIMLVMESVSNDHPEIFWLDINYSYRYTEDGNIVQIVLKYNDLYTEDNLNSFNSKIDNIIVEANKFSSDYEKEKYVHNLLINNITYDANSSYNQTIYSAIVNKRTVCAGYAKSFQYIMTKLGIPTYYVTGTANESHAWNIIKLDNSFYNVDLTWDDNEKNTYLYFNIKDSKIDSTHTRSLISSKLPGCYGDKYSNLEIVKKKDSVNIKKEVKNETAVIDNIIIEDKKDDEIINTENSSDETLDKKKEIDKELEENKNDNLDKTNDESLSDNKTDDKNLSDKETDNNTENKDIIDNSVNNNLNKNEASDINKDSSLNSDNNSDSKSKEIDNTKKLSPST